MMHRGWVGRMSGALAALMLVCTPLAGGAQVVPVQAVAPDARGIVATLHLTDLMPVLQDEAVAQADDMGAEILEPADAAAWTDAVRRIHDPARLARMLETGVAGALPQVADPRIRVALEFYAGPLGQRLLMLELSARRAMLEPGGEDAARDAFDLAEAEGAPRVEAIRDLIDRADLIEPNVAGALNAALAFSRGFADGGGYPGPVDDAELLAQVAMQEPEIRSETVIWVESYLLLAYSGLSDEELAEYAAFAATEEGRALASVLFSGFDALFTRTAHEMGLAAAGQLAGQSL